MKKKILVLGGTGFIGYHILKKAIKKNFSCTSISKTKPTKQKKLNKVKYILCDLENKKKLKKKLINNYNYVVNAAGYVDHSKNKNIKKVHYNGIKNIIDILKKKKIESFIQIGSCLEYGDQKSPQTELGYCNPKTNYSISKYKISKYLMYNYKKNKFPFTVLRIYQVYGPYQQINRIIPFIIKSCLLESYFPCTKGDQIRNFLYIDDLTDVIFKVFKNKKSTGKIFNVGTNEKIKINELIKLIVKIIGNGKPIFGKIKMRKEEVIRLYPNLKKIQNELGWKSRISLINGLNKTINFLKKNI